MENKKDIQFMDRVIEALRKTAINLEEFQVKIALGKAEAQDKYEEVKKKFNLFIHESEFKIEEVKEDIEGIKAKFDELRVQLALGKAESKEVFENQKKLLLLTLHEIEVKIKSNETLNRMYALTLVEIEQFKIQLEILEQNYNREKSEVKNAFEKGKQEFNAFIDKVKTKYAKNKEETKLEHFQNEILEAFIHFKKAFSKP